MHTVSLIFSSFGPELAPIEFNMIHLKNFPPSYLNRHSHNSLHLVQKSAI